MNKLCTHFFQKLVFFINFNDNVKIVLLLAGPSLVVLK